MRLGVTVGEGQIGGAVMIRGRQVAPLIIVQTIDEEAVIDRVGMFIEEHEGVRRVHQVWDLKELDVVGIELVGQLTRVADHGVHGHAADPRSIGGWRPVRRTLEHRGGSARVGTQQRVRQVNRVDVVIAVAPVLDIVRPGVALGGRFRFSVVVDQPFFVLVGIEQPGEGELLDVVQAGEGLRPAFGLAEGRQQQSGKQADDGDDYQQFDEREARCGPKPD